MSIAEIPRPAPHSPVAWGLLLVAVVVFWPLARNPADLLVGQQNAGRNDLTAQFLAMRTFPRDAVEQGAWPLWNPWMLLGQPYVGNPQAAIWYPPNWLAAVVGHPAGLSWLLVTHQLWAGLGTYCFCRRLGCQPVAALFGGVIAVGAPFYIAQIGEGHYNQVCLAAWIPWAFWAFEGWRNGVPSARWLLPVMLALAVFAGHVQEAYYLVLALSLLCLGDFVVHLLTGHTPLALRWAAGWIGVGAATAGLTAVEVLPIVVQMKQAVRGRSFSVAEAGQISAGWDHVWQLLDPFVLGGPAAYQGSGRFYWETLCYFGVLPLVLAGWGVIGGRREKAEEPPRSPPWQGGPKTGWVLLLVFAVLFALGPRTPVYAVCHQWVPGVALFRAPSRMLFLASILVAALAAVGVNQLLSSAGRAGSRWVWGLGGVAALILTILTATIWTVPAEPLLWQRAVLQPQLWGSLAAGCLAAVLMTATQTWWSQTGQVLGLAVITVQLSNCSWGLLQTVPAAQVRRESSLTKFFIEQAGVDRILVQHEHLSDDEAFRHRLCKLPGYEPVPLVRAADLFDALTSGRDTPERMLGFHPVDPAHWHKGLLDLLGVRWLVVERELSDATGWTRVAHGTVPAAVTARGEAAAEVPYVVYRNDASVPRAFVVGSVERRSRTDTLAKHLDGWNPRETVFLEQDVLPAGPRAPFQPAEIVDYNTQRVVLETEIAAPGYLVLTDVWYPGWRAVDDTGRELPVLRANHSLRAVPLPAGKHRVMLAFTPPLWWLSAFVSLVTVVVLVAVGRQAVRGSSHSTDPAKRVI